MTIHEKTGRPCWSHGRPAVPEVSHPEGTRTPMTADPQSPTLGRPLTEAERTMLRYALDQAQEQMLCVGDEFSEDDHDAIDSLRRLADEAQQQERESGCAHCGGDHSWDDCQTYTAVVAEEAPQPEPVHGESVAALAGYQPDGHDTWDGDEQVTAETDDCCGAEPTDKGWIGYCWCTLPPGHDGEHQCQPCTDRHGAPGWTDEPAVDARQDGAQQS